MAERKLCLALLESKAINKKLNAYICIQSAGVPTSKSGNMVETYLMILPGWPLFRGVKRDDNLEQAWPTLAGHVKGFSGR